MAKKDRRPGRPAWIETFVLGALSPMINAMVAARIHPNAITSFAFAISIGAALSFHTGWIRPAGFLILLGGVLDIFDGHVARGTGLASAFGSFYDATLDRISELVVFVGLLSLFLSEVRLGGGAGMVYALLIATGGSLLVSYTRSRAELLGIDCKVGLMQRAERVVLLGGAALVFGWMWNGLALKLVIVAMAVLTSVTAFQRIVWVHQHTRSLPPPAPAGVPSIKTVK